jgi:hypothetical protein
MIGDILDSIALAATERRPLPPALRELGRPLATAVADRLEAGESLPQALRGALDPALADLLAGPRPPTAEAALLVAEWLRMQEQQRLLAITRLTHPICGLAVVTVAVVLTAWYGPSPQGGLVAAAGVVLAGAVLLAVAGWRGWAARFPVLGASAAHALLANTYERAALVARWRLPEAQLAPLLGEDLLRLAPVLADPGAETHCRQLATYHREAAQRASRRLWWAVMGMGYVAGGCLLLAAAVPVQAEWIRFLLAID